MSAGVTVLVRIRARQGMERSVERELVALLASTRSETGCINFDLHRASDDATLFMVHENWVSEEDLSAHFEMPYIREWLAKSESLLAEPMELTRWRRVPA
jgi:quinol monooxygenase YgiN